MLPLALWFFLALSCDALIENRGQGRGVLLKDCNVASNGSLVLSAAASLDAIRACKLESPTPEEMVSALEDFLKELDHEGRKRRRVKRIVGGRPADPPLVFPDDGAATGDGDGGATGVNTDDSILFVDEDRTSKIKGSTETHYKAYRGIKFAEPPVGQYRFQRPKRRPLKGDVDATSFGPPCPQYDNKKQQIVGDEDCLFLNVFTPKDRDNGPFPVLFWIHGGGFISGSSAQYDPISLVKQNLVVVTTQYRLGSLGFLGDTTKDLPGNAGLFDVVAALHWTKKYIERFGGDPNRVVVGGHGSGAAISSFLGLSDFSRDLISGIFSMSGTPISSFAIDDTPRDFSNNITRLSGCEKANDSLATVKCMQKHPFKDIIKNDLSNLNGLLQSDNFVSILSKSLNPSAVVEGENDDWFLPFFLNKKPIQSLQTGQIPDIPLLTGVTTHETSSAVKGGLRGKITQLIQSVPDFLDRVLPTNLIISNTGLFGDGKVSSLISTLFGSLDYLKLLTFGAKKLDEMDKVIQMTTDALYNLPVFLISNYRAERANTFLYSFEHVSPAGKAGAKRLFRSSPIFSMSVGQNTNASPNEVSHGEDVASLYDIRSLEGNEIEGAEIDSNDMKTKEVFSAVVAKFAYYGKPSVKNSNLDWLPFSKNSSEYLVIKAKPELKRDFHYCEMGLWSGLLDRLRSSKCNFPNINTILSSVPSELWNNPLTNTIQGVGNSLNPYDGISAVGNALTPSSGVGQVLTGNKNPLSGGVLSGNTNPLGGGLLGGNKNPLKPSSQPGGASNLSPLGGLVGLGNKETSTMKERKGTTTTTTTTTPAAPYSPLGGLFSSFGGLFG